MHKKSFLLFTTLFLINFISACNKDTPCKQIIWYQDLDKDGLGNKNITIEACDQPPGFVDNAKDDNDTPKTEVVAVKFPTKGYTSATTYKDMKLIWADEFEGTELNEKFWNYEIGNNNGWGNKELEYYRKENTTVKDGYLIIEAKQGNFLDYSYTSSRLTTQNKVNAKYVRIDIRGLLPKGQGIWPAFWMLGKNITTINWPKCGEIDIMEMVGGAKDRDNVSYGTPHWEDGGHVYKSGSTKLATGIFNDEFHVFSVLWDEKQITWLLDDVKFYEINTTSTEMNEFREEYFFLINLAVGGEWPGKPDNTTQFPQYLIVDYIRLFQ